MTIPRIRSESPAFDLHHPEIAALELMDNEEMQEGNGGFEDAPATEGRAGLLGERPEAQGKDIAEPNTDTRDQD